MKNNDKKNINADHAFMKMLMPSIIGILVCAVLLCGTTWAWFSAPSVTSSHTIQSANYALSAEVKDANGIITPEADGSYILNTAEDGNGYIVTLTASGTATKGYCIIRCGAQTLHTESIRTAGGDNTLTFTLYPDSDGSVYTFRASWGEYAGSDVIRDGDIVGE